MNGAQLRTAQAVPLTTLQVFVQAMVRICKNGNAPRCFFRRKRTVQLRQTHENAPNKHLMKTEKSV